MKSEVLILLLCGVAAVFFLKKKKDSDREQAEIEAAEAAAALRARTPAPTTNQTVRAPTKTESIGGAIGAIGAGTACAIYATPAAPLCASVGAAIGSKVAPVVAGGARSVPRVLGQAVAVPLNAGKSIVGTVGGVITKPLSWF